MLRILMEEELGGYIFFCEGKGEGRMEGQENGNNNWLKYSFPSQKVLSTIKSICDNQVFVTSAVK